MNQWYITKTQNKKPALINTFIQSRVKHTNTYPHTRVIAINHRKAR